MAHELELDPVTGKIPLFYYGTLPWHSLGYTVADNRPATAAEAIMIANQGWTVEKYPSYVKIGERFVRVPGSYDVVRQDTLNLPDGRDPVVLTTNGRGVGEQYVPLQNIEAFGFFDNLVGAGKAIYHTVGTLRQGDRIWILAKLPQGLSIGGVDNIDPYILLTNSHDGSSSIQIMLTLVRVVCANTLRMALSDNFREVKIRHTESAKDKLAKAGELLGVVTKEVKEAELVFKSMAAKQLNTVSVKSYFNLVYPTPQPNGETGEITARVLKNHDARMDILMSIFEKGSGADLPTTHGTLFGAFNTVTDYVDHYGRRSEKSTRMESLLSGHGDGIKQRAFTLAKNLVA